MKLIIKILIAVILIATLASFAPAVLLYIKPLSTFYTNGEAAAKLKNNTGEHFEFIAFGDNHGGFIFNDSATLKLIRHINREDRFKKVPIDFVAVLGDVTFQKGTEWDYRIYNKLRAAIKWPVISLVGNHDDNNGSLDRFHKYIGAGEFSFTNRNSYFIVLDNSENDLSDKQFQWLESELANASRHKHKFILMHKAPISPYQQSWYRPELSPWAYRFMKLCERYKVDMVLSGHEHMFKKASYGGVKYITTGGGGMITQFPDRDGGFLHYIVVRIYGDYVDYEVRKIFPPLWEFLTYYIWKDVFYSLRNVLF